MRHRMAIAVMALLGLLLSVYLTLYKLGVTGPLMCGAGDSCERVQTGPYGDLFGIPVAAYGVAAYAVLLAVAMVGIQPQWLNRPEPSRWLAWLALPGVLFTAYLKFLEIFVIHAICRWCVVSAVLIVAIFVTALWGRRSGERGAGSGT